MELVRISRTRIPPIAAVDDPKPSMMRRGQRRDAVAVDPSLRPPEPRRQDHGSLENQALGTRRRNTPRDSTHWRVREWVFGVEPICISDTSKLKMTKSTRSIPPIVRLALARTWAPRVYAGNDARCALGMAIVVGSGIEMRGYRGHASPSP